MGIQLKKNHFGKVKFTKSEEKTITRTLKIYFPIKLDSFFIITNYKLSISMSQNHLLMSSNQNQKKLAYFSDRENIFAHGLFTLFLD